MHKSKKESPSPGSRMPGDRSDRTIVPDPAEALSCEGLVEELLPGPSINMATGQDASNKEVEMDIGDEDYTTPPDKSFTPAHSIKRKAEVSPDVSPEVVPSLMVEEDDLSIRPAGNHRRITTRLYSSSEDIDDPDVTFTGSTLIDKAEASRIRILREKRTTSGESPTTSNKEVARASDNQKLDDKSILELKDIGFNFLDEIERARTKSTNIKGNLSGVIKSNVSKIRDLLELFYTRLETKGDLSHLRQINIGMAKELAETKAESSDLKREIKEMRSQMDSMSTTIRNLQAIIEKLEKFSNKVESRIDSAFNKMITRESHHSKINTPSSIEDKDFFVDSSKPQRSRPLIDSKKIGPISANIEGKTMFKVNKHKKPRIISNIQVTKPNYMSGDELNTNTDSNQSRDWQVVSKKPNKKINAVTSINTNTNTYSKSQTKLNSTSINKARPTDKIKRKPPRCSVVSITGRGKEFSYADALKTARENISLQQIGIDNSRIRRAANGGILIEIPGQDSSPKADILANQLLAVLGEQASISRPIARGDIKIYNMDVSITKRDIQEVISNIGICELEAVRVGEIKPQRNGLFLTWVNCPLAIAIRLARMEKISLGWSRAGVELLKARPTRCFKCWHYGHLKNTCNILVDRQGSCFKCGNSNHQAGQCSSPPNCLIYQDKNIDSRHSMGTSSCPTFQEALNRGSVRGTEIAPVNY